MEIYLAICPGKTLVENSTALVQITDGLREVHEHLRRMRYCSRVCFEYRNMLGWGKKREIIIEINTGKNFPSKSGKLVCIS